ncbi:hypothetical protein TTHERM_00585440 (macronuclear) [Tetrahymena thermophila SB210]|uniref:Uncharacterized protein n=1 Tax=Tetrahymena thermophila (strain SB210) TaxID=312017 RepID=I7MGB1_TETTS|nr:hypothetical protein TTHERM_00585440 [Tetrahymena thermophila SB210]EAR84986.1 hypothetical protein TTHERM_00585440 [Tetrahymena thermophila SB210]|eukprot:XP_001032649.1 hypothetical protein TTHERM_00585440 [Tetrahymena thermophila SB210]
MSEHAITTSNRSACDDYLINYFNVKKAFSQYYYPYKAKKRDRNFPYMVAILKGLNIMLEGHSLSRWIQTFCQIVFTLKK